jgi:hypothetical protein
MAAFSHPAIFEQPWPGRSLTHVLVRSRRLEDVFKAFILNDYFSVSKNQSPFRSPVLNTLQFAAQPRLHHAVHSGLRTIAT